MRRWAAWAAGSSWARNGAPLKPSTEDPVRTNRCVSPSALALATMAVTLPPSTAWGCHNHMPLPTGRAPRAEGTVGPLAGAGPRGVALVAGAVGTGAGLSPAAAAGTEGVSGDELPDRTGTV